MARTFRIVAIAAATGVWLAGCAGGGPAASAEEPVYTVALAYDAPGEGPAPNFSPKGTQAPLTPVAAEAALPAGAARPAMITTLPLGPDRGAWMPVMATADATHPADLTRLFFDRNRNGDFGDDGPPAEATPNRNEKTGDWWSSFDPVELSVPYADGAQPYLLTVWMVRDGAEPPAVLRFSRRSWRSGTVEVHGVPAVVAVMDANNDAMFDGGDHWSVLAASTPDAGKAVLSIAEARPGNRMMFVEDGDREWVLELRSMAADGRSLSFAVVDRPTTKAMDRAGDDPIATERGRPRAEAPFVWGHDFDVARAEAASTGRRLLVDFEAIWCGPCKTMDEWIWTDAEVVKVLRDGFVGVKVDGDVETALVDRFTIAGYPTMVVLDPTGTESTRAVGYQNSAQMLALLAPSR
jgi:thiol-disulfide isomerase/thioredoxin